MNENTGWNRVQQGAVSAGFLDHLYLKIYLPLLKLGGSPVAARAAMETVGEGWPLVPLQEQFETTKLNTRRFSRGSCLSNSRCAFRASSSSRTVEARELVASRLLGFLSGQCRVLRLELRNCILARVGKPSVDAINRPVPEFLDRIAPIDAADANAVAIDHGKVVVPGRDFFMPDDATKIEGHGRRLG